MEREYIYYERGWYPWSIAEDGIDILGYRYFHFKPTVKEHIPLDAILSIGHLENIEILKIGGRGDEFVFTILTGEEVRTTEVVRLYLSKRTVEANADKLKKDITDISYRCFLQSENTQKYIDAYNHEYDKFSLFTRDLEEVESIKPYTTVMVDGHYITSNTGIGCFVGKSNNEFRYCLIEKKLRQQFEEKQVLTTPEETYEFLGRPDVLPFLYAAEITNRLHYVSIPVDDIVFYYIDGDIRYQSIVSGGEIISEKSSIKGAIIGGLIGGDAGAIIGSRPSVSTTGVTTKVVKKDDRTLVIRTHEGEHKTSLLSLYDYLLKLIPEKDAKYISIHQSSGVNESDSKLDGPTEIRKYKELLDDGIITEEEFTAKKKQLLGI